MTDQQCLCEGGHAQGQEQVEASVGEDYVHKVAFAEAVDGTEQMCGAVDKGEIVEEEDVVACVGGA